MPEVRHCAWFGTVITDPTAVVVQPMPIKLNPSYAAPTFGVKANEEVFYYQTLYFCKDGWIQFQRRYARVMSGVDEGLKTVVDRDTATRGG